MGTFTVPARWGFRTRLTLTITTVFVVAGIALLTVVYLLVSRLLGGAITDSGRAIGTVSYVAGEAARVAADSALPDGPSLTYPAGADTGFTVPPGATVHVTDPSVSGLPDASDALIGSAGVIAGPDGFQVVYLSGDDVSAWFVQQSQGVAGSVLAGLLLWSGVALVAFAALAAALAAWISRRALRRIGEVTAMAKDMSTHDLHRRLELPGPQDEIKELADTIDGMLDRLERSFAGQQRFVANASHELRTPLTTARTALEIPLAQGRVPAELEPALQTALRAGRHSENLITALLDLARGTTAGARTAEDLADIVPSAVAARVDRLSAAGLEIELNSTSTPVDVDPVMIAQAVGNLLDNAINHNVPGGRIRVDVAAESGEAVLTVRNTGRELDPAAVPLLAEPFYRAESSRIRDAGNGGAPGVGLGLSIVQAIAQAHDGRLELRARDGGGLVARLVLPIGGAVSRRDECGVAAPKVPVRT